MEVTNKLSALEKQIAHLNEELAKQSKAATYNSSTFQDLMVSIENLGDNMVKMSNKLSFWREIEEELEKLIDPISLPK